MKYEVTIIFEAYEDSYEEGEIGGLSNEWTLTLAANTPEELQEQICDATYTDWKYIDRDENNDTEEATAYATSYLANADNDGDATNTELAEWREGKTRLWAIHCNIFVSKVSKEKVTL